jgi:hypothetical protein
MADRKVKILTPATSTDFVTLAEAKTMLGIVTSTPDQDAQLAMMISWCSAVVMRICNRDDAIASMAYETLTEDWRELGSNRVYLSHWPVKESDIQSVAVNGVTLDPSSYDLEQGSGKLSNYSGWQDEPITVTYSGGYQLPDEAPLALKQATVIFIVEARMRARQSQVGGVRQISHKEARVSFFDPNAALARLAPGGGIAQPQAYNLLYHYIRFEV